MDSFPFSLRTHWPQESNALNKILEDLQARRVGVLDLTASNPTSCGFSYPQEWLQALSTPENLSYKPDPRGLPSAREAVARYYSKGTVLKGTVPSTLFNKGLSPSIDPKNIILTASTSEAYSFLFRLLVNPGEKVLIPRPSYPLFQFLLDINDVKYDYYPLRYEDRWHIDLEALGRMIDDKTRAIVVVNPNNPTGSYIAQEELDCINQLCLRHKMSLISDEVFFDYAWEEAAALKSAGQGASCLGNQGVLTFVLGGLSKTLCLPQMKCAWILASGPQAMLQEALTRLETIADTYLSVNTPVQNALGFWLDNAKSIQQQVISRLQQNGQWLSKHLDRHTQLLSCQGGWYATLRIPAVKSEEEWALEFLREDHVLVYPGYFFDMAGGAYIVVSLLPPVPVFQEAWGRIQKRLGSC